MNRLLLSLYKRPAESKLWYSGSSWKNVSQVLAIVKNAAKNITLGSDVALACALDEELALGILSTSGRCNRVLLVPTSWKQKTLDQYLLRAKINSVISTREDITGSPLFDCASQISHENPTAHEETNHQEIATNWIIPTSGTTGDPKLVEHTLSSLTKTVKENSSIGAKYTWGMLYELGRFAGLQVFFQAMLGGSRLVFPQRCAPLSKVIGNLITSKCNAISATPTLWRRILMAAGAHNLTLKLITLGGEISDQSILKALAKAFSDARIIHIYASTEAGVGFTVSDGFAGFPASYLTSPPGQVELNITNNGTLWLKPVVAGQKYVMEAEPIASRNGWINSGDLVTRKDDRYYFLGRENGAINVGGNKVFPEEVENVIKEVDGVLLALVKGKPNPFTGFLVMADIKAELGHDESTLKAEIIRHCKLNLEPYKVPALLEFNDGIKINESGKTVRK